MNRKLIYAFGLAVILGCGGAGVIVAPFDPAAYTGHYTGTWHNVTYNTTGNGTMDLTANTTTKHATFILDLDGSVFGGSDPGPITMVGTYDDSGLQVSANTTLFGGVNFTIDQRGNVAGSASNVPGPTVQSLNFVGSIDSTKVNLQYNILFENGGTANGTLVLTKN